MFIGKFIKQPFKPTKIQKFEEDKIHKRLIINEIAKRFFIEKSKNTEGVKIKLPN
jgi:hypothetical protein